MRSLWILAVVAILPTLAFAVVSLATMIPRARAAHARYHVEHDGLDGRERYPSSRKAILPFVL